MICLSRSSYNAHASAARGPIDYALPLAQVAPERVFSVRQRSSPCACQSAVSRSPRGKPELAGAWGSQSNDLQLNTCGFVPAPLPVSERAKPAGLAAEPHPAATLLLKHLYWPLVLLP